MQKCPRFPQHIFPLLVNYWHLQSSIHKVQEKLKNALEIIIHLLSDLNDNIVLIIKCWKCNLLVSCFAMTRRYSPLCGPTSSSCRGLGLRPWKFVLSFCIFYVFFASEGNFCSHKPPVYTVSYSRGGSLSVTDI